MSINDFGEKIKSYWSNQIFPLIFKIKDNMNPREEIFIVMVIILVGLGGFGLGKLSAWEKNRLPIEIRPAGFSILDEKEGIIKSDMTVKSISGAPQSAAAMVATEKAQGLLVASKSGKKYHYPWCAGASQIADKNKIWFSSFEQAQSAGYTPASNCPGLK